MPYICKCCGTHQPGQSDGWCGLPTCRAAATLAKQAAEVSEAGIRTAVNERCLVCGHYHGGQGACVTSIALVGCVRGPLAMGEHFTCATCKREREHLLSRFPK